MLDVGVQKSLRNKAKSVLYHLSLAETEVEQHNYGSARKHFQMAYDLFNSYRREVENNP